MSALLLGSFLSVTLSILFVIICLFLVFMVVITPSQEGGMAAAFGGMGSETFFGTRAHQHISKFTLFLAVSFLVLAIALNKMNSSATDVVDPNAETPPSQLEEDMKKLRPQDNAPPNPGIPPPSKNP